MIEQPNRPHGGINVDLLVVRGLVRATFDHPVDPRMVNQRLAASWSDVIHDLSGDVDILRVAGALDPRWRDPLNPPSNRVRIHEDRWRQR